MIYLQLFFTFLKVGLFAFGGGYSMLSLISNSVIQYGWMSEEEMLRFVGVETVIPGPIAVNMATYVGYEQAGFFGALLATIGVVLPSFVIILLVASCIKNLLKYPLVQTFIVSIRPSIAALILSVALTMALTVFFGVKHIKNIAITFDYRTLIVLAIVAGIAMTAKYFRKKEISSIVLVLISGALGVLLF